MSTLHRLVFCMLFCVSAGTIGSASAAEPPPRTLSVSGEGEIRAAPDQSSLSAGVTTGAATAAQALAANSRAMNAVFATLKKLGIPDKDIQTSNFSLSPQYQVCKPGATCPQRIVGYQVSNNVNVTVENLDKTGPVLDALVSSGSNQIGDIGFSIHDTSALLKQAREAAVKDAIDRGQTYARAAGVTLGPILLIQEGGGDYQPRPMNKVMAMMASAPPIAGGEQSISANVTITWAIQ